MTLARIPLAALFPFVARSVPSALAVVAAAGLSDMLDGWLARRRGEATPLGTVLDPIADKTFAITVVATLIVEGRLPLVAAPALLAREILEAPLLLWHLARPKAPEAPVPRANGPGKLATTAQFATVLAAIAVPEVLPVALGIAALTAVFAGISYWHRDLQSREPAR